VKLATIIGAFAAGAIAVLASGCADGGGGPPARPLSPFGTDRVSVTGSEPTTGGNDVLPGQETSLEALCSAACTRLERDCPAGTDANCQDQFRAFLACVTTAPISCRGLTVSILACDRAQAAVATCVTSSGRR
jgi:hypothetical protein